MYPRSKDKELWARPENKLSLFGTCAQTNGWEPGSVKVPPE